LLPPGSQARVDQFGFHACTCMPTQGNAVPFRTDQVRLLRFSNASLAELPVAIRVSLPSLSESVQGRESIPGHSPNKCHLYNLQLSYTSINYSGHLVLQVAPSTAFLCVRPKCQPLQLRIPRGQLSHRRSLQQPQGALIVLVCWRVCARFGMTWTGGGNT
jgi:hypothetical protein